MTIQPSILNWYNSLTTSTKYLYEDENATYDAITKEADFLSLLEVRQTLSTNLLRSTLQKKSRVVMFGAGGTASWFLPASSDGDPRCFRALNGCRAGLSASTALFHP